MAFTARLRRLRALSAPDRSLLLRAWAALLLIDLGLRTLGYAGLRRRLERRWPPAGKPEGDAGAVARTVDRAARHHLYPMRCLQRSLALEHLLRRSGHAAGIRFGVRRDDAGDELRAHAWVEVDGRPLGEPGEIEGRFARLVPAGDL
jgi:Transglutaminase-like superfamily